MEKAQRVVVCGNDLVLVGVKSSLGLDRGCDVIGHAMPATARELRELQPDVVIFELEAVPHEFIFTLSKELPGVLLIGIDLETNRALLWSGQQAEGWTSQDLTQVIHQAKFHVPISGRIE